MVKTKFALPWMMYKKDWLNGFVDSWRSLPILVVYSNFCWLPCGIIEGTCRQVFLCSSRWGEVVDSFKLSGIHLAIYLAFLWNISMCVWLLSYFESAIKYLATSRALTWLVDVWMNALISCIMAMPMLWGKLKL